MARQTSFYSTLMLVTSVVVAMMVVLTVILVNTSIVEGVVRSLHVPGLCYVVPHIYTLINTSKAVNSAMIKASDVSLYVSASSLGNTVVVVEDRGGCGTSVHAIVEGGALRVKVDAHGCCSIRILLPKKIHNLSLDLSGATLKLTHLNVDRLAVMASASALKIVDSSINIGALTISASAAKLYRINVNVGLSLSASSSVVKLELLNKGASIVLRRTTASSVSESCPEATAPRIAVSASTSSIEILCTGTR